MLNRIKLIVMILFFSTTITSSELRWRVVDTVRHPDLNYVMLYEGIDCFDSLNCCAIGNMEKSWPWSRTTSDGGKSWFTTLKDTIIYNYDIDGNISGTLYNPPKANEISYPSEDLCIAVGDSCYYWRSTDGCLTWEKSRVDTSSDDIENICFINNKTGGVSTWRSIFLTMDGGITWKKVEFEYPDSVDVYFFNDLWISNENTVFAIAGIRNVENEYDRNYFIVSYDFGDTWKFVKIGHLRVSKLFFINQKIGWAAGAHQIEENSPYFKDVIVTTTNGGMSWDVQLDTLTSRERKGLRQIYFCDSENGVALGAWFKLWRTTDGGENWIRDEELNSDDFTDYLWDLHFFNHQKIIALGEQNNLIYKYSDEITSVNEDNHKIRVFPNPFEGKLTINFYLEKPDYVEINIYDNLGRKIATPANSFYQSEYNEIYFDAENIAPGIYYCILKTGNDLISEKIIVVR